MRSPFSPVLPIALGSLAVLSGVLGYRVPIRDTDNLREVCSGMWGGKEAYIEVAFDPTSSGQVALVIYEWSDVAYLGVDTPDNSVGSVAQPKTYICTTSAVRSGLCTSSQIGEFITNLPAGQNSSSIFTSALTFSSSSFPTDTSSNYDEDEDDTSTRTNAVSRPASTTSKIMDEAIVWIPASKTASGSAAKETDSYGEDEEDDDDDDDEEEEKVSKGSKVGSAISDAWKGVTGGLPSKRAVMDVEKRNIPVYSMPIEYSVAKTGYYCVGVVPVTLVSTRSERNATHAEFSGMVLFRNTFDGELPAVEYPKINFYLALSVIYFAIGCGWAFLCVRHFRELLPMQYYISGTILFLILEMLAQFAYYRYINKHGGGTSSLVFLFVIATLNAARNSLSFFLLLIVAMGLSVVTQSLGSVMTRIRLLTGFHFIFGVLYSVGTVEVELDSASLIVVMILIFPLALTLTAWLMWIIVSLNGTITHLAAQKQRYKLQMFQRLWRILILAVIAVGAFFVISSLSLSNRLDEDYAPRNWKYRWILLDGSLATIYLCVFTAIAWLWRPTRDNVRFAMSQELAQDEHEADAEDYELTQARGEDDEDEDKAFIASSSAERGYGEGGSGISRDREVGEVNVVFAMGDDSDDDDEEDKEGGKGKGKAGYRDSEDEADHGEGLASSAKDVDGKEGLLKGKED